MKKKMIVVSMLSLESTIPHFAMFRFDDDCFRVHNVSASGTQLWELDYNGTIEGLHEALIRAQNNSHQFKAIEKYITNLFQGDLSEDVKTRINDFVKNTASWTMFDVLESVIEP